MGAKSEVLPSEGVILLMPTQNGTTVAHSAAKGGSVEVLEFLYMKTVDFTCVSNVGAVLRSFRVPNRLQDGSTLAHEAAHSGNLKVGTCSLPSLTVAQALDFLASTGADLSARGSKVDLLTPPSC